MALHNKAPPVGAEKYLFGFFTEAIYFSLPACYTPFMHLEIPHKTTQKAAVDRVKRGLVEARPHMAGQVKIEKEEWNNSMLNFAFTTQGKEITGTLRITDEMFILDAKLPLLWRMFEGKIEKMIKEQAQTMLGQKK